MASERGGQRMLRIRLLSAVISCYQLLLSVTAISYYQFLLPASDSASGKIRSLVRQLATWYHRLSVAIGRIRFADNINLIYGGHTVPPYPLQPLLLPGAVHHQDVQAPRSSEISLEYNQEPDESTMANVRTRLM